METIAAAIHMTNAWMSADGCVLHELSRMAAVFRHRRHSRSDRGAEYPEHMRLSAESWRMHWTEAVVRHYQRSDSGRTVGYCPEHMSRGVVVESIPRRMCRDDSLTEERRLVVLDADLWTGQSSIVHRHICRAGCAQTVQRRRHRDDQNQRPKYGGDRSCCGDYFRDQVDRQSCHNERIHRGASWLWYPVHGSRGYVVVR